MWTEFRTIAVVLVVVACSRPVPAPRAATYPAQVAEPEPDAGVPVDAGENLHGEAHTDLPPRVDAEDRGQVRDAGSPTMANVFGPKAMTIESLTCPEGSGEAGENDYDVQLMKKHCMAYKNKRATGPAAILTFGGEEVARAELLPSGKIKSCYLVKKEMVAALKKSRFRDFAKICK